MKGSKLEARLLQFPGFSDYILYVCLISIFYFYGCFEASNGYYNSRTSSGAVWPEHWNHILKHSETLQLILLDSDALKCVYANLDEGQKGCQALFGNKVIRFGSAMSDFSKFMEVIDVVLLKVWNFY